MAAGYTLCRGRRGDIKVTEASVDRARDFARADADWSWEADTRLRITRLCDRFAGATGHPPHLFLDKPLLDLGPLPPELIAACERQEAFHQLPVSIRGDGECYGLSGSPAFDEQGRFQGYRGIATRRPAGSDADIRSTFLSSVSHEFRTPLNAIIGFAEAMDSEIHGPLSDRYAGYVRDIAQAGRHLLSLIEDILDASAIERGHASIEPGHISVARVIEMAASIVSIDADARGVNVARKSTSPELAVIADERRFCQILVNLLGNAIKFAPDGGRVEIGAHMLDDTRVAIAVRDDGPGIAPEDQHRIFDKFERLQHDPFVRRKGAGLGLAIARELAQRMCGTLDVESVPGEGSRFTLTLPAA